MRLPVPYVHKAEFVDSPVLTYSPHPLLPEKGRELLYTQFFPGETIEGYLGRMGILERMGNQPFSVLLNGHRIPEVMWSKVRPKVGAILNVCAVVRDGGGGGSSGDDNKEGRSLAMIAVMVVAMVAFGPGGLLLSQVGGAGLGSAIAFAGTVAIGNLVVTSIFPFPKVPVRPDESTSPTYSIDGGSNTFRKYEPMPKICGRNRVFPDLGAQPYTEFIGQDQIAYYVYDFGYNDVDLSEFKLGDTPIENYTGVIMEISDTSGNLTTFPANVDTIAGAEVTYTEPVTPVIRTSSPQATALSVEITGSLFGTNLKGEVIPNFVSLKIEARRVGDTTWIPIKFEADINPWIGARSVAIKNFTTTMSQEELDGSIDNSTVIASVPDPDAFLIFNSTRQVYRRTFKWYVEPGQYEVQVTRLSEDPFVVATTNEGRQEKGVSDIVWTQLRTYQADSSVYTGRKRVALRITASGQLNGHIDQLNCIASAKCPVFQPVTGANTIGQYMPGMFGMSWATTQSGWVTQATSNPAWWYLDAVRGRFSGSPADSPIAFMPYLFGGFWGGDRKVYGAGQPDTMIDLDAIKSFAVWCENQGLTFNYVFDQQQSVYGVLQTIALCGRGTPSWATGKLGVIWDAPNLPITAVYGMHNIIPGTFKVSYAIEDLADVIEGWFINPDLDWQKDFVRVQVPGTNTQNRPKRIELIGRTSRALAAEDSNLYAAQNAYRNRKYVWQTDWEGMPSSRGDVIMLQHDLASLDYSGRFIEGGNEFTLKLPKKVPLFQAGSFIVIVKPDGSFGTYPIQAGTGSTDTLLTAQPLPFNPWAGGRFTPYDYKWHYGPTAVAKKLKIDSIRPASSRLIEITAIDEFDYFYTAKSNPFTFAPPNPLFGDLTIQAVTLSADGVRSGTGYTTVVTASWDITGDYDHADISVRINDGTPVVVDREEHSRSTTFNVTDGDDVEVTVTAFSSLGLLGKTVTKTVSQNINFAAQSAPGDVTTFTLAGKTFKWNPVEDVDVIGYQIRFFYGTTPTWETSVPLHDGLLTASPWEAPTIPTGRVDTAFLIKAIDAAQIESVTATILSKDLGDVEVDNVVILFDFKSLGWIGTLTGGFINAQDYLESTSTNLMWDAAAGNRQWDNDGSLPMYDPLSYLAMQYEDSISIPGEFEGYNLSLNSDVDGGAITVEYRTNALDRMWADDDDAEPMWLDSEGLLVPGYLPGMEGLSWRTDSYNDVDAFMPYLTGFSWDYMWAPFGDYKPWTGPVTSESTVYDVRLTTGQGSVKGLVRSLDFTVDVPDVIQRETLLSVPAEGLRIPLTKDFHVITVVSITLQHLGTSTAVTAKWLDKNMELGPLIQCFDTTNLPTFGVVNVSIEGY